MQCDGFPNQCTEPMVVDNFTVSALYGQCNFDSYDTVSLSCSSELKTSFTYLAFRRWDSCSVIALVIIGSQGIEEGFY